MTNSRSTRSDLTPSLFDEPAAALDAPAVVESTDDVDDIDDWTDVPQARFFAWSPAMQLQYCWRRDLDAALRASTPHDATFFIERAALYKADLDAMRT